MHLKCIAKVQKNKADSLGIGLIELAKMIFPWMISCCDRFGGYFRLLSQITARVATTSVKNPPNIFSPPKNAIPLRCD
jgi:hypothetical protein